MLTAHPQPDPLNFKICGWKDVILLLHWSCSTYWAFCKSTANQATWCFVLLCLISSWCVQGLSLSSTPPSSEDGIISVCPATTVTLTCSASGVGSMGWRDQDRLIGSFTASDNESSVIDKDPYTLTLVSIEKYDD